MQRPNSSVSTDNYAGFVDARKIHALLMSRRYLHLAGTEMFIMHEKKIRPSRL